MSVRRWLLPRLFAALYDRLAPLYDQISLVAFAGEWARWQAIALRYADRAPVVELGCGTGQAQAALRRAGLAAAGVDPAAPMLRRARRRAAGRLIQARAQQLPLRSGSVGTLLSIFPTAYILDPATWREAERVLAPGGRFVIVDHGWLTPDAPHRRLLVGLHRLVYGAGSSGLPPPLPHHCLPRLALVERSAHGFVSITVATRPG
jgi:ubiquinone/menaquinone biosynthesis C-methylase UbiE